MSRDYKNRLNQKKKKQPIPGWWWMVTGLLIGGFIMFLSNLKEPDNTTVITPIKKTDVRHVKKPEQQKIQPIQTNKPRFDFYTILPNMEVVIPEAEIEERRRLEGTGKGKVGTFIIQIGSFKKMSQADTLKARLALLGIESSVQTINQSGTVWHRVKSGPHKSFLKVDRIQNKLHRNHMDSIIIKVD